MPVSRPLEVRFWEKVKKTRGCWVWTASTDGCGYGTIGLGPGKKVGKSHRVSWEMHRGPVPKGLCVLHTCDNPRCVKPEHLFLGTQKENAEDRERKGRGNQQSGKRNGQHTKPHRTARGCRHGNSVLSSEQVKEIRGRYTGKYGEQKRLAAEYGVNVQTIRRVTQGKTYTEE